MTVTSERSVAAGGVSTAHGGSPRRSHEPDTLDPVVSAVLGLIGFALGWFILSIRTDTTPTSVAFRHGEGYTVWRAVMAGEVAFWFAIAPMAIKWRIKLQQWCAMQKGGVVRQIAVSAVIVVTVLAPAAAMKRGVHSPLAYTGWRMVGLYALGLVAGVIVLMGLVGVHRALESGHWREAHEYGDGREQHLLEDLQFLESYKRRFLGLAGALISLTVVSIGVWYYAVNSFYEKVDQTILSRPVPPPAPAGLLIALGGLFVAILAIFYVPCHARIRDRGEELLDCCVKLCIRDPDVGNTIERRNLIRDELGLRRSAGQALTDAILILTPLMSGAIALFISANT